GLVSDWSSDVCSSNVGHGDGVAIAEATGEACASHVSLQTSQSLSDPMAIPRPGRCVVGTELRLDVLEHTYVIERVNITADDLRHRSHVVASMHVRRHQRRLRVDLVQILDDGHGLNEGSIAIDQQGYQSLSMQRPI